DLRNRLRARRAREREAKRRKDVLVESVRTHLLPALIERGFAVAPRREPRGQVDRKCVDIFPLGEMRRARSDGGVDLVEIQFKTYQRAAFRINATAAPKEGMMTVGGTGPWRNSTRVGFIII